MLTRAALDLLLPLRCLECGRFFSASHRGDVTRTPNGPDVAFQHLMVDFLCPECRRTFTAIQSPMCSRCGRPFTSPHGLDHPCGDCRAISFDFQIARAAGRYEGVLRTLVHGLKYQGCVHLAVPLGRLLWSVFLTYWDPMEVDAVIPIPLHPKRLRARGFNQAYQLIRHWPGFAGIEGAGRGCPELRPEWLRRPRPTDPQTGLPQRQREANVKHAFELGDAEGVKEHRLVLVDDVMTTGATAQACARLLKRAGAARVDVLTLARAV